MAKSNLTKTVDKHMLHFINNVTISGKNILLILPSSYLSGLKGKFIKDPLYIVLLFKKVQIRTYLGNKYQRHKLMKNNWCKRCRYRESCNMGIHGRAQMCKGYEDKTKVQLEICIACAYHHSSCCNPLSCSDGVFECRYMHDLFFYGKLTLFSQAMNISSVNFIFSYFRLIGIYGDAYIQYKCFLHHYVRHKPR